MKKMIFFGDIQEAPVPEKVPFLPRKDLQLEKCINADGV